MKEMVKYKVQSRQDKVPVNEGDCQVEGLWEKLKLLLHIYKPVNQYGSHLSYNIINNIED